jgi:hypothetical protein
VIPPICAACGTRSGSATRSWASHGRRGHASRTARRIRREASGAAASSGRHVKRLWTSARRSPESSDGSSPVGRGDSASRMELTGTTGRTLFRLDASIRVEAHTAVRSRISSSRSGGAPTLPSRSSAGTLGSIRFGHLMGDSRVRQPHADGVTHCRAKRPAHGSSQPAFWCHRSVWLRSMVAALMGMRAD